MSYLPCCNLFFQKKEVEDHKTPVKARDLLLTGEEKGQVAKFIKAERKKKRNIEYRDFKGDLLPDLIEFIEGLELTKMDAFINSLARKDGCFEFPLVRNRMVQFWAENELSKVVRLGKVKKRHDLVFNAAKTVIQGEVSSSRQGCDQDEMSPKVTKMHSFLTNSSKKLKPEKKRKGRNSVHSFENTMSGLNFNKETSEGKSVSGRREDPAQGKLLDNPSQELDRWEEVEKFKNLEEHQALSLTPGNSSEQQPGVRVFGVPSPITTTTEKPKYFLKQPQNESSELRFFHQSLQEQFLADPIQGTGKNLELKGDPITPQVSFLDKFNDTDSAKKEQIKERLSETHSGSNTQFGNPRTTKLQKVKQLLAIKKQEEAEAQNWVIEIEELVAGAETKAIKAEKAVINAEESNFKGSETKAIEAQKAWNEAEDYLKELLKQSSPSIEKAEKFTKEVEDLESEMRKLVNHMEIDDFKSDF